MSTGHDPISHTSAVKDLLQHLHKVSAPLPVFCCAHVVAVVFGGGGLVLGDGGDGGGGDDDDKDVGCGTIRVVLPSKPRWCYIKMI